MTRLLPVKLPNPASRQRSGSILFFFVAKGWDLRPHMAWRTKESNLRSRLESNRVRLLASKSMMMLLKHEGKS